MHYAFQWMRHQTRTYTYSDLTLTGSITGLSISNVGSESNYIILIQNQISNRVYMTPVDSNGSFKFNGDGAQLDNLVAETKTYAATLSDSIESSIMFMNLKIDY